MHFSWKMGSKMEPKSMPKSYNNDFGRPKGRPGPIVNVFRLKKDGKRSVPKVILKFEPKKKGQKPLFNRLRTIPGSFLEWSGGKGGRYWIDAGWLHRRLTRFAPRRGAADENSSKNGSGIDLGPFIIDFWAFWSDAKKTRFFDAFLEAQKSEKSDQGAAKRRLVRPGSSPKNGFFGIWVPGAARARPESR